MIATVNTLPPHLYQADVRQVNYQDVKAAPGKIDLAQKLKKPQKKKISPAPKRMVPAPGRDPAPLPPPTGISPPPPPPPGAQSNPPPAPPANQSAGNSYSPPNYLGPAVSFGSTSQIGAVSRFGLGKNFSIRPSLFLGDQTQFTLPLTYDFALTNDDQLIMLHAGGGVSYQSVASGNSFKPLAVLGADLNLGGGATFLLQLSSTFSDFAGIVGVGLQF